jgi:hypothetical protein
MERGSWWAEPMARGSFRPRRGGPAAPGAPGAVTTPGRCERPGVEGNLGAAPTGEVRPPRTDDRRDGPVSAGAPALRTPARCRPARVAEQLRRGAGAWDERAPGGAGVRDGGRAKREAAKRTRRERPRPRWRTRAPNRGRPAAAHERSGGPGGRSSMKGTCVRQALKSIGRNGCSATLLAGIPIKHLQTRSYDHPRTNPVTTRTPRPRREVVGISTVSRRARAGGGAQEPSESQISSLVVMRSTTASVNSVVDAWPPRSIVRHPAPTVSRVAS